MKLPRTLLALALTASGLAWGGPLDSPERIARLDYVEGQVAFHAAQEQTATALPDRPMHEKSSGRSLAPPAARAKTTD